MRPLLIYVMTALSAAAFGAPGDINPVLLPTRGCGLVMLNTPAFIQVREGVLDWWQSAEAREYGWTERWWQTTVESSKPIRDPLRAIVAQSPESIYVHLDIASSSPGRFDVSIFREGQKEPVRAEPITNATGEYTNDSWQARPPPMSEIYQFDVSVTMYLSAYGGSVPVDIASLAESVSMLLPRYRSTWAMAFQPGRGIK